jgi:hypothetical protein
MVGQLADECSGAFLALPDGEGNCRATRLSFESKVERLKRGRRVEVSERRATQ